MLLIYSVQTPKIPVETITSSDESLFKVEEKVSSQDLSKHQPEKLSLLNSSTQSSSQQDELKSDTLESRSQTSEVNSVSDPVETTPILQPLLTPTKKSKVKRMYMKVEKSQNISSSSSSTSIQSNEIDQTVSLATTTTVINLVKTEQLSRKESDDSIAESDQDQCESSNSSEPLSTTPDPEDSTHLLHKSNSSNGKCPSFTKEPGTGQTVMVKDGVEESETFNICEKPKQNPSNPSNVVSVSVNVGKQQRNKNKKQRAQQKREEKVKKKRKEKEDITASKRITETHESYDKESVSSSTNSTDNLEEDHASNELTTPEEDESMKASERKGIVTRKPVLDNEKSTEILSKVTEEKVQQVIDVEKSSQLPFTAVIEDIPLEEETNLLEMETSCSSIEFQTPGLSPSPDDLTVSSNRHDVSFKLTPRKDKESVTEDVFVLASDSKISSKSVKMNSHPSSPDTKQKTTSSLPSTPGKTLAAKTRPSKLELPELSEINNATSSTLSSVETDGVSEKSKGRLAPHELAASLLKKIPLPQKQKQSSCNQMKDIEDTTSTVRTQSSHRKKSNDNNKFVDNGRDKRHTPLSSDAMPFFPHHPGHHYTHAHNIPPPMPQPFPPNRASLPPPHYLPNSPYEYPMMRPIYPHDEQMHQFDRKQRKRSDHKYSSKAFSPPTHSEPRYHDRPHPFPIRNYDSENEWMDSHTGSHSGYSDEDPFALSYPVGHRRSGYPRVSSGSSYGFGSDMSSSMDSRPLDGPESIWDPSQLTPDEIIYLKELRRQRLKKMMEKHQQMNNEQYEPVPAPARHSSDPYSLASLRERDMDTARHSRADPSYPPIETDPVISKVVTSFRNHDEQRGLSRDDPFSWPSATTPDSLNRAPGPPGSFPSDSLGQNNSLSSPMRSSLFSNDNSRSSQSWREGFNEPKV